MQTVKLQTLDDVRDFVATCFAYDQSDFAKSASCARQSVYLLTRGKTNPRTDTLDGIFSALGVDHEYLPRRHVEPVASSSAQLGPRLRSLLSHLHVSEKAFAERLGIIVPSVRRLEQRPVWSFNTLYSVAHALRIPSVIAVYY